MRHRRSNHQAVAKTLKKEQVTGNLLFFVLQDILKHPTHVFNFVKLLQPV